MACFVVIGILLSLCHTDKGSDRKLLEKEGGSGLEASNSHMSINVPDVFKSQFRQKYLHF